MLGFMFAAVTNFASYWFSDKLAIRAARALRDQDLVWLEEPTIPDDVPGHVRFIKNMLAGVGAVDACLFVVAATEGWKPQSEEHLRILELLGATHGIVAMTKVGLVDDEAFARSWIASRQPGKGLAKRALAQELRRKGITDEVARDALDEIDPADEEAAARALVRKKLRSLTRVDDATATRRLVGLLARVGSPY